MPVAASADELTVDGDPDTTTGSTATASSPVPASASHALTELRRPVAGAIRWACLLSALGALAGLAPFIGLAALADALFHRPIDHHRVVLVCWLIVAGLVARAVLSGAALTITHFADVRLQATLRRRMVRRLGGIPLGWFTEQSSGRVRKAAMSDVHDLHQLVAHHDVEMTAAIVMPLGGLVYLLWLDWRLALLALVTIPVYACAYAWMMRGYGEQMRRLDESSARVNAATVEFISGIAVVKTFGQARTAFQAYRTAASDFGTFFASWVRPMLRVEALASMAISSPVIGLATTAGAVWFVHAGWVSTAQAITCVLIALVIPTVIQPIGFGAQNRRTAAAAAQRIHELLALPELPVPGEPRHPQGHRAAFDEVRFSYDGRVDVLRGVTFTCEPGTVTALVGPSGSGKSTVAALLVRFYDVTGGAVRVGGVDLRQIEPAELYRNVGFVLQDVQLVHGSIGDNVRLGRPGASDDEVVAACVAAQIHSRVLALPRGYDSVVGDDAHLSGGEAQRVSIARALLADTPLLVLDEATAFADAESEAAIQDALSTLAAGRTVLVIAHRLSTITGVDQIVVLDGGQVVEKGTHAALLAASGAYARMWAAHAADTAGAPASIMGGTR